MLAFLVLHLFQHTMWEPVNDIQIILCVKYHLLQRYWPWDLRSELKLTFKAIDRWIDSAHTNYVRTDGTYNVIQFNTLPTAYRQRLGDLNLGK